MALVLNMILGVVILISCCAAQDRDHWQKQAHASLQDALAKKLNVGVAKNVILFIGDGMGVSTITAARILKGQMEGLLGENYRLEMEKLPFVGFSKTYTVDKMTPDSAGTATAIMSGVKTRTGVLGVDSRVKKGNCSNVHSGAMDTIKDWALDAGKWTV